MRRALAALVVLLAAAPSARAASVTTTPVPSSGEPVVYLTAPPGDTHRLFLVEKTGAIRVVKDGQLLSTPFLSLVGHVSGGSEQGLLSMAFAPDYATSGLFYVDYTDTSGDSQVVQYHVSADPDVADASSAKTVLSQPQPEANHNGGLLLFGPDGDLYVGFGDGGGGGDMHGTNGNGQDLGTWLGKILRISPSPGGGFTVPTGNPFAGNPNAKPEIWAYGLRNPWRFSFDSATGDLWIGDVGQGLYEEIDHAAAGVGGQNYGWRLCEGTHQYVDGATSEGPCTEPGVTAPVLDYSHEQTGGCAVVGGYVVHDPALGGLDGHYVYGDDCTGDMWAVCPGSSSPDAISLHLAGLSSFGLDASGRLYAMSSSSGDVVRLTGASETPCPASGGGGGGGGGPTPGGGLKGLHMTFAVHGRARRSGRITLRARCPAGLPFSCNGRVRLRHGGHAASRFGRMAIAPGHTASIRLTLSNHVRRSLARRHRLTLRVVATTARATFGASVRIRR